MSNGDANSGQLYVRHETIHAREINGIFERLRSVSAIVLLSIYYLTPWIKWNGRQAILFDLPARKFFIFDMTLWPQDFVYLSWLLIMAALLLFLATSVAGRLWCGFACPQTVWTKAFVWLERLAAGNFMRRKKLDQSGWNSNKLFRKGLLLFLWLTFAFWTGFTFLGYFTPIQGLGSRMVNLELGGWETFWICFYSLATFGNAGYLREQVCKYMCPYARFQSAMFDRDSLIVSYDAKRGEPRGGRKRGQSSLEANLGDCIDCNICVQVCPTGIDIREGLQYECIACAACVDACDGVMDRMNYPKGLVRFTTQNTMDGKPTRVFRLRTMVYSGILAVMFISFVYSLATRNLMHLDVIRDRNALYRVLPDNRIENVYTLKMLNKSDVTHTMIFTVEGLPGITIETDPAIVLVEGGEIRTVAARISAPPAGLRAGSQDVSLTAAAKDDESLRAVGEARFIAPPRAETADE
jgi:cytochrome c oxidase accessory protein FixG